MADNDEPAAILTTAGDAERAAQLATALVWYLGNDPRVRHAFIEWRIRHGLYGVFVDPAALKAAIFRDTHHDLEVIGRMVGEDLSVPYTWLPMALLIDFVATIEGEVHGSPRGFVLEAPTVPGLPAGRKPKQDGYILRDVEWLYRARIKRPPDTSYALAKEHARTRTLAGISTVVSHSKIDTAIERTDRLLRSLEVGTAD